MSLQSWLYRVGHTPSTDKQCLVCGEPVPYQGRGQPRRYCPGECRAEAARQQQREKWKRHRDKYNAKRRKS